jgi:cell division septation protein DedD
VNTSAPAAAGTGYRLQLGAVRTEEAAKQEWQRLQRAQSDLLGKLSLTAARVDLGDKGIFYRIQAGPIADGAEAAQSCATLKSRNVGCVLVKP